jgi:phosphatidate phosphatase APP1
MAALCARWAADHHAAFHYVSASPWHLFPFLADFLAASGFPPGTFHLRAFRLMPRDIPALLRPSFRHKRAHARALLSAFPGRRFVLVGDSGERDPELYAGLAREFPAQVAAVFIRDTTGEPPDHPRWRRVFAAPAPAPWRVFERPADLAGAIPARNQPPPDKKS